MYRKYKNLDNCEYEKCVVNVDKSNNEDYTNCLLEKQNKLLEEQNKLLKQIS